MEIYVYRFGDKLLSDVSNEKKYQQMACSDWVFKKSGKYNFTVTDKSGDILRKYFVYDGGFVKKIQGMRITKACLFGFLPSSETLEELTMRFSRYEPFIIIR
jgi:hypothetical protein